MESGMPPIPSPQPSAAGFDRPDMPPAEEPSEHDPDTTEIDEGNEVLNDEVDESNEPGDVLSSIRQAREEAQPFGKTKILEVPGYRGLLAIEYNYIGSEITEAIARKVRKETRSQNGQGTNLLSSIDTLRAACKRVLCRRKVGDKWISIGGASQPFVRLDVTLSSLLGYSANDGREVVLGLFGSEHKIVQQNVILSQWLADQTRETDEDFLS